jgi:hypothetical protein
MLASLVAFGACAQGPQNHDTLATLSEAVSGAGVSCEKIEPGPEAKLVKDSGSCVGSEIVLYVFENQQDLEDWSKVAAQLAPTAAGPSWAVTGELHKIETVADELDAELLPSVNP